MNTINKYLGALAIGSMVLAMPSCSDTWDEHYDAGQGTSATLTLWEQIKANPELSNFAAIAEQAIYYKDEVHPLVNPETGKPYTFKDVFNGTQLMTVWAPENSALTSEQLEHYLELLKTSPYSVHQQLMGNSIALWRNVVTGGGVDTLAMLNGKKMVFDKNESTMQSLAINKKNVEATNGTLHTMTELIPFQYNIYEFIKDAANASANGIDRLHEYIIHTDTTYFNQNASIEGNPDAYGHPTYVDSAYVNTNMMFFSSKRLTTSNSDKNLTYMESFGANIEGEDSAFVMIMPTTTAWQTAYDKLQPLYKYANKYVDNQEGNNNTKTYIDITPEAIDSVTKQSIDMDIISPLCFNAHKQPKLSPSAMLWTTDGLMEAADGSLKYLLNTYGDTLRTDDEWQKTSLWAGKKAIKMSNGYGVVSDEWNFPRKLYQPDVIVEIGWQSFYNTSVALTNNSSYTAWGFSNTAAQSWVDQTGRVSHDNFYELKPKNDSSSPDFMFRLVGTDGENRESEVMSGTYDIAIVCVPDYYKLSSDSIILNSSVAYISPENDTIPFKHKIIAELSYCNNAADGKDAVLKIANNDAITYEGEKVDTIVLFKDFTFPYSYKNLRKCYPTLKIGTYSKSADRRTGGFSNNLCIDQILLIAKDPASAAKRED